VRVPDGGKRRGRSCDGWMVAAHGSTSIAFGKVLIDSLHFFSEGFLQIGMGNRAAWSSWSHIACHGCAFGVMEYIHIGSNPILD
jgi:hypothetical protein